MSTYKALVIPEKNLATPQFSEKTIPSCPPEKTLIKVSYSSVNYKDALAVTGKGRILKHFPLTPGIDLSGEVVESKRFKTGEKVLVTGCGLGEYIDGGFAEYALIPSEIIVPLPKELSLKEAMIYGTAAFTAGLCLTRMEINGQTPEKGPIAITGASGGVGYWAIHFFQKAGYEVIAFSGKEKLHNELKELGASKIITPEQSEHGLRPLEKGIYGGAVDNLGGKLLSQLCSHTKLWGNIACVGLADTHLLETTVMPLILRGVSLLGISSANCPEDLREKVWQQIATDLKPKDFEPFLSQEISLEEVPNFCEQMMARKSHGRTLVKL